MKNKDFFAEFAVLILKELFDSFPIPISLDKKRHLGGVVDYPESPVRSYFGIPGSGVYVGPDMEWVFDRKQQQAILDSHDWSSCEKEVEELIGRALSDEERDNLFKRGVRPYTDLENEQLQEWKEKVKEYNESDEQYKNKEKIYEGTVQFLVHEGYIRIIDLPEVVNNKPQPQDVLIERAINRLRFSLTNKGYVLLNKKPPLGRGSIYDDMKAYVADKSSDAIVGASAGSILSALLGGF